MPRTSNRQLLSRAKRQHKKTCQLRWLGRVFYAGFELSALHFQFLPRHNSWDTLQLRQLIQLIEKIRTGSCSDCCHSDGARETRHSICSKHCSHLVIDMRNVIISLLFKMGEQVTMELNGTWKLNITIYCRKHEHTSVLQISKSLAHYWYGDPWIITIIIRCADRPCQILKNKFFSNFTQCGHLNRSCGTLVL